MAQVADPMFHKVRIDMAKEWAFEADNNEMNHKVTNAVLQFMVAKGADVEALGLFTRIILVTGMTEHKPFAKLLQDAAKITVHPSENTNLARKIKHRADNNYHGLEAKAYVTIHKCIMWAAQQAET